ncbi:DUF5018 domain-containing protein [Tissierella praeacuta]|uniref:DUF5018 domain-containing protein n=1 Tax=Tissierella praeacuta TaxID=43131 RepID=UPI001C111DBD|nr:DUF5018 domain-containing protein [Tissierella praeacuta]MBU5256651.1 DUF5018 domain-containing protein [Tissierella praeacuta]
MKGKKIISLVLTIMIIFSIYTPMVYAGDLPIWWAYKFNRIESKEYFVPGSIMPENICSQVGAIGMNSTFLGIKVSEATITKAIAKRYVFPTAWIGEEPGQLVIDGKKHNYSLPVKYEYKFEYDNGREDYIPVWIVNNKDTKKQFQPSELEHLREKYIDVKNALQSLIDKIDRQGDPKKAGDYHPMQGNFLKNAKSELEGILTGSNNNVDFVKKLSPETIDSMIEKGYELIDYVESRRINEAEILDFKVNGYSGEIDKENNRIRVYIPEDENLDLKDVKITTPDWVISRYKSGELSIGGTITYTVQPIDALHHRYIKEPYYGLKEYDYMKEDWVIEVFDDGTLDGDKLTINSLIYTSKYGEKINADILENKIELNIPFDVDLSKIELNFYHTGKEAFILDKNNQEIKIEGNKIKDISNVDKIRIKDAKNEKVYDFIIKSERCINNEILDFRVDIDGVSYKANIDNEKNEIEISVPYSADISRLKTDITIDHRAIIEPKTYEIQDFTNPVIYTVISESGDIRKYTVVIKRGEASSENEILSFKVGTIEGRIEEDSITVKVPSTVDLERVKPFIKISPKAKVKPDSYEEMNFSKGSVDYIVIAENGEKRIYKVSIESDESDVKGPDEEYIAMLKKLRDNIYKKYKEETTSEDWEWMNIGFYEGTNNGFSNGIRKTADDLPRKFDMYDEIGELSSNKATDIARFTMVLTAMGIDASNLEPFKIDSKPFKTDYGKPYGKEIINFPELLYMKDSVGINGSIFSLIALDMGNYSIPINSDLTRDDLIRKLLDHEYGSDEFGIDMVAMLMQALYPYQNHPIYGEQVQKKLEHGMELFLGSKSAKKVEPLNKDFLGISWGNTNSESTAQVIIALCSMGIDPFSDHRFSRGPNDNMIVNWINRFATKDLDGFGHTDNIYNFMGTYQGMYTLQWYINFIEKGGEPYSLYYDVPFDFSKKFSSEAKIAYFELLGKEGIIDYETDNITIELSQDISSEELKDQIPIIKISEGATIYPKIEEKQDFNKDVEYRVTAEDGKTIKRYTVKVKRKEGVKSSKKNIEGGEVEGFPGAKIEIDNQNSCIKIELPVGTNKDLLKELKISFSHQGISISPDENEPQDFTKDPVTYKVTAEDGTTREYEVQVTIKEEAPFWFTKFVLRGVNGKIDKNNKKIYLKLPFGTYVEEIYVNEFKFEPNDSNTSVSPGLGQTQNYEKNNKVSINPYPPLPEGENIGYEVDIEYISPSGNGKIQEFSVSGVETNIKGNTIELKLPKGIDKHDIEDLAPKIKWTGKTIDPEPNKENNSLRNYYKDYVLTDGDGNVNLYTVKIVKSNGDSDDGGSTGGNDGDKNKEKEEMKIESFKIKGIEGEIDNVNGKIYIELPYELDLRNLSPTIKTSKGSNIYPASGQPLNLRRSARFTLSDGKKIKEYKLIILISEPKPATKLWEYIDDYNDIEDYQVVY